MTTHPWHSDRRKYRYVLLFRGIMYGSLLWPLFATGTFLVVAMWTERDGWRPPQMKPNRPARPRRSHPRVRRSTAGTITTYPPHPHTPMPQTADRSLS